MGTAECQTKLLTSDTENFHQNLTHENHFHPQASNSKPSIPLAGRHGFVRGLFGSNGIAGSHSDIQLSERSDTAAPIYLVPLQDDWNSGLGWSMDQSTSMCPLQNGRVEVVGILHGIEGLSERTFQES